MNDNKLKIKINDATTLVAEIYDYGESEKAPNELTIYLEKDGLVWQDIAIARQGRVDEDSIQLLVYGDKDNEDYTNTFEIDIWEEEKPTYNYEVNVKHLETYNVKNVHTEQEAIDGAMEMFCDDDMYYNSEEAENVTEADCEIVWCEEV